LLVLIASADLIVDSHVNRSFGQTLREGLGSNGGAAKLIFADSIGV